MSSLLLEQSYSNKFDESKLVESIKIPQQHRERDHADGNVGKEDGLATNNLH